MDALRPFSDLIRTLWKSSASRAQRAPGSGPTAEPGPDPASEGASRTSAGTGSLEAELGVRLRRVGLADPQQAREVFVETVMARELGISSAPTDFFAEIAQRVAARIGSHPKLSSRLHSILTAIAEQR